MKIFKEGWEKELEMQHFSESSKFRAYICSPLNSENTDEIYKNMHRAREYMYYASKEGGFLTCAPHAYLPAILNDNIPSQRELALDFGMALLKSCQYLLVCGKRISNGMKKEIMYAATHYIRVLVFDANVKTEVENLIWDSRADAVAPLYFDCHPALAEESPKDYLDEQETLMV